MKLQYQLYFGQLHSHTQYSDGAGSLEDALAYVKALPAQDNVQFVAYTDHSNYFDKSGAANPEGALYDMSKATEYSQETLKLVEVGREGRYGIYWLSQTEMEELLLKKPQAQDWSDVCDESS